MKILENLQSKLKKETCKTDTDLTQEGQNHLIGSDSSKEFLEHTADMARRFQSLRINGGTYEQLFLKEKDQITKLELKTSPSKQITSKFKQQNSQQFGLMLRNSVGFSKRAENVLVLDKSEGRMKNSGKNAKLYHLEEKQDSRKNVHSQSLAYLTSKSKKIIIGQKNAEKDDAQESHSRTPKNKMPSFLDLLLEKGEKNVTKFKIDEKPVVGDQAFAQIESDLVHRFRLQHGSNFFSRSVESFD